MDVPLRRQRKESEVRMNVVAGGCTREDHRRGGVKILVRWLTGSSQYSGDNTGEERQAVT